MLKVIPSLPANVFGFSVIGTAVEDDYLQLRPYFHEHVSKLRGGVNLLVDVNEAEGLGDREFWEYAQRGLRLVGRTHRLVLIGSQLWTDPFDKLAKMLKLSDRVMTYPPGKRAEAIAWSAGMINESKG